MEQEIIQPGEVLALGQACLVVLSCEVSEIPFTAKILLHHLYGAAAVDSVLYVYPVDVIDSG